MSGLKLKFGPALKLNTSSIENGSPATPTPSSATTPGGLKLKIKTKSLTPSTPAAIETSKTKKSKAGRPSKPSAKVKESLKRSTDHSDIWEEGSTIAVQPPTKKVRLSLNKNSLTTPKTPTSGVQLKAKVKGKPPKRPLGEGYDSEASDGELDPAIEEQFVLRMFPGDDCDYLRQAIIDKKVGLPKANGGADVHMKFMDPDGRRAAVTVKGNTYAASLVDLPCIVEGMKSWDKRGWWKSADICQMLWVFAPIGKEEEARTIPLPSVIDPDTYQYPHGLTPPMHFARKRRFRKRISRSAIEAVEDAVEKLLAKDEEAREVRMEVLEPERHGSQVLSPEGSSPGEYGVGMYSQDEDAEGEDDQGYFEDMHQIQAHGAVEDGDGNDDLEADLLAEMEQEAATPVSGATPAMAIVETPQIEQEEVFEEDDSGDESIEDESVDGEGAAIEVDDGEKARQAQLQGTRDDLRELENQLAEQQRQLVIQTNNILKKRVEGQIKKTKVEIQLKKTLLGEEDNGAEDE